MSGDIGFYTILPDQMQVVNPLLILAFIPLFDTCIYPLLTKCRVLRTPLQRLTVGGLLAAVSFCISAIVELQLEVSAVSYLLEHYINKYINEFQKEHIT